MNFIYEDSSKMNLTVKHWNTTTTEIFNLLKFYEILVIPTEILNLVHTAVCKSTCREIILIMVDPPVEYISKDV